MAYINIRQPRDCRCRQGPPGDGHQCIKAARGWPMLMYDSQEIVDAHRGSQELYARLVMVIYLYNFV